jgi:GT2 family glycosyltransferase
MIPAIIVPILNRPELLERFSSSVDVPVERMIVIDNGGVVPAEIEAIRLPHNIGVAASWNLGLMVSPKARWWLICNFDITFAPGDLEKIAAAVDPRVPMILQAEGYAAFAITPPAVERIGLFDTGYINGYVEDDDYTRRAQLAGVPITEIETGITHVGSSTIYGDKFYMDQNHTSFRANVAYYEAKWGGPMHGGESFSTPFNAGGDIRDVRTDFGRLRRYTWRRR